MKDHNKQEQGQTEVAYQTLSEFLQSTPPNQRRHISDLSVLRQVDRYTYSGPVINEPELELHCPHDLCNGVRFFRSTNVFSSSKPYLKENNVNYLYVIYQCSNCQKTVKVYSLVVILS